VRFGCVLTFCSVTDLTISATASLNVTKSLLIDGRLTVYHPMTMIVGDTLSLATTAHLQLHITSLPPVTSKTGGGFFFVVPIASYGSHTGQLANVTVQMNYAVARSTSQPCYVPTNSTPVYGQSTLSVVVNVQSCDGGGGLSTGAIVGIAVGATAGGILVIVVLALVVSRVMFSIASQTLLQLHKSTKARTARMNKELRGNELHDLQHV
jgi:hypothetical protein